METLRSQDPEVARAIEGESQRQQLTLNLIAAENYVSPAVLEAQGSVLTNKYAEGYPDSRYYGGCRYVDLVERLARERAQELFQAEHANVQPHSGSQANLAAYFALLNPGDTVLAMSLPHGGHLSHGTPINLSGKHYRFFHYGVDPKTELLDCAEVARLAREHRPKLLVAGASSYPRVLDFPRLREIAEEVGALLMVDMAHIAGLVAAGVHPSPVPHAHVVTSSTHKTLRGPRGGLILSKKEFASRIDKAIFPGTQGGPLMHVIAAKAVAFGEAMKPEFFAYQKAVVANARLLAQELGNRGLRLVSGGTDNHLLVVDLRSIGVSGKAAEAALEEVGIIVNRNAIPFDPQPPQIASGIRLGTPALTTRGLGAPEVSRIAHLIVQVLTNLEDGGMREAVAKEVAELARRFPAPGLPLSLSTRPGG